MVAVVASRSVRLGVGRILRRRSSIYSTTYQCDSALIAWSEDGSERLESQGIKVSTRIIGCDCRNGVEAIPRIQAIPCWLVSWNLVHIPNPPFLVAQIFQPPGSNLVGFAGFTSVELRHERFLSWSFSPQSSRSPPSWRSWAPRRPQSRQVRPLDRASSGLSYLARSAPENHAHPGQRIHQQNRYEPG